MRSNKHILHNLTIKISRSQNSIKMNLNRLDKQTLRSLIKIKDCQKNLMEMSS